MAGKGAVVSKEVMPRGLEGLVNPGHGNKMCFDAVVAIHLRGTYGTCDSAAEICLGEGDRTVTMSSPCPGLAKQRLQ